MRKDIAEYLANCTKRQQVKVEHQNMDSLLQPIPIPEWKLEVITLEFITGPPKSKKHNDSIMVIVDKLSKVAHFIPIQSTFKTTTFLCKKCFNCMVLLRYLYET